AEGVDGRHFLLLGLELVAQRLLRRPFGDDLVVDRLDQEPAAGGDDGDCHQDRCSGAHPSRPGAGILHVQRIQLIDDFPGVHSTTPSSTSVSPDAESSARMVTSLGLVRRLTVSWNCPWRARLASLVLMTTR